MQPLSVAAEIKHILGLGPFCVFDTVLWMASVRTCFESIGLLVLISVERYVFIKLPLRYDDIVTEKRVIVGALTAWAISAVRIIEIICQASINTESDFYSMLLLATDLRSFLFLLFTLLPSSSPIQLSS